MTGTLINTLAVLAGSLAGLAIRGKLPERFVKPIFNVIGLITLYLGFVTALKTSNYLLIIISLVLGVLAGELMQLDANLEKSTEKIKQKIKIGNQHFTEGFLTAFLLFCMGSFTILGTFEEGLTGKSDMLITKSILDGISSIALAAAMGSGVLFAAIPLFVYQAGLTLFAQSLTGILNEHVINDITGVGGIMLIALGFGILEIKKIKVINLLPALIFAAVLSYLKIINV